MNRLEWLGIKIMLIGSFIALMILLWSPARAQADEDITLGWGYDQAEEDNITEFLLYYADSPDPSAWILVQMDAIAPQAREVVVVIAGTADICFMLRAARGSVMSANSNSACWTVPPPPPPDPPAPDQLFIK